MKKISLAVLLCVATLLMGCENKSSQAEWQYDKDNGQQGWFVKNLSNGNQATIKVSCAWQSFPAKVELYVDDKIIPESDVAYKIDGQTFDKDHIDEDCRVCSANFTNFWNKLSKAKEVSASYLGKTVAFKVKNESELPPLGDSNSQCQTAETANKPIVEQSQQNAKNDEDYCKMVAYCAIFESKLAALMQNDPSGPKIMDYSMRLLGEVKNCKSSGSISDATLKTYGQAAMNDLDAPKKLSGQAQIEAQNANRTSALACSDLAKNIK